MAGISKAERERRAKEQRLYDSRHASDGGAMLLGVAWMDELHAQAHAEDADKLHRRFMNTVEWLEREMAGDQKHVDEFREYLKQNPAYHFEWADSVVESSARIEVNQEFLNWYRAKGPWAADKYATSKALSLARNPSRSTSQCHNLVALYRASAWAKLVEDRRWGLGF
jgi:hypothetical protein